MFELYPTWNEHQLSKKRDELVAKNGVLSWFACRIKLSKFIIMGQGESVNFEGQGRDKILSDTMEAIIGAIFIDSKKDYQVLRKFILKQHEFQNLYDKALIDAVLKEDVENVSRLLKLGANPNVTGSTTIFVRRDTTELSKEPQLTLLHSGYESISALHLAMVSNRVIPSITREARKPSPGRMAYLINDRLHTEPRRLLKKNPSLEDVFAVLAPIHIANTNFLRSLDLTSKQPGYQLVQDYFESDVTSNCLQIIQLLLQYGADPNKKTWFGETPLHAAASLGNATIINLFLQYKADVTITNAEGKTAKLEAKNPEIAKLLEGKSSQAHKSQHSNCQSVLFKEPLSKADPKTSSAQKQHARKYNIS